MSTPYVGEIRSFGFSRVPNGWFSCDGSLQAISQYETLYTLIGTTYGGDGISTFGLPDLRGRLPVHQGQGLGGLSNYVIGALTGAETVTLLTQQIPQHTHILQAYDVKASTNVPGQTVTLGQCDGDTLYYASTTAPTPTALAATAIGTSGGSLPHENCMPTTCVSFCIAWAGVFPTRN